jgi:hypothetical protein
MDRPIVRRTASAVKKIFLVIIDFFSFFLEFPSKAGSKIKSCSPLLFQGLSETYRNPGAEEAISAPNPTGIGFAFCDSHLLICHANSLLNHCYKQKTYQPALLSISFVFKYLIFKVPRNHPIP